MEMVPAPVAAEVTKSLSIPTIGIGAGPDCDAQVLVWQDMMGLRTGKAPRFVKRYAELHDVMLDAARTYADEVANGVFPAAEHSLRELSAYRTSQPNTSTPSALIANQARNA